MHASPKAAIQMAVGNLFVWLLQNLLQANAGGEPTVALAAA
jgi:hypothetical protein